MGKKTSLQPETPKQDPGLRMNNSPMRPIFKRWRQWLVFCCLVLIGFPAMGQYTQQGKFTKPGETDLFPLEVDYQPEKGRIMVRVHVFDDIATRTTQNSETAVQTIAYGDGAAKDNFLKVAVDGRLINILQFYSSMDRNYKLRDYSPLGNNDLNLHIKAHYNKVSSQVDPDFYRPYSLLIPNIDYVPEQTSEYEVYQYNQRDLKLADGRIVQLNRNANKMHQTFYIYPDLSWYGKKISIIRTGDATVAGRSTTAYIEKISMEREIEINIIDPLAGELKFERIPNNEGTGHKFNYSFTFPNFGKKIVVLQKLKRKTKNWIDVVSKEADSGTGSIIDNTLATLKLTNDKGEDELEETYDYRIQVRFIPNPSESDGYISRESSLVTVKGLLPLINFNITQDKNNWDIKLNWDLRIENLVPHHEIPDFQIQVQKPGSDTWIDAPGLSSIPSPYNVQSYKATYTIPEADRFKGNGLDYKFRLRRKVTDWVDYDNFLVKNRTVKIDTDYKSISDMRYEASQAETSIKIYWELSSSGIVIPQDQGFKYELIFSGQSPAVGTIDTRQTNVTISGLASCKGFNAILKLFDAKNILITQKKLSEEMDLMIPDGTPSRIENFTTTKGYYTDRVALTWSIPKDASNFSQFCLYRKEIGSSAPPTLVTEIAHDNLTSYSYDDRNADVGVYYQYTLSGYASCGNIVNAVASVSGIGFSQAYATISGRVTYTGSQPVDKTDILVMGEGKSNNRGLKFGGVPGWESDHELVSRIEMPTIKPSQLEEEYTYQAWVKSVKELNDYIMLFCLENRSLIQMEYHWQNGVSIMITSDAVDGIERGYSNMIKCPDIIPGEFFHISVTSKKIATLDGGKSDHEAVLYINGTAIDTITYTRGIPIKNYVNEDIPLIFDENAKIMIGTASYTRTDYPNVRTFLGGFSGTMDEIRLWNRVLSGEEIKHNYDRYITGKENGLLAYYRCDEPNDVGTDLFDISATGSNYHRNDAKLIYNVSHTQLANEVPASTQLAIKGITDKNGNYLINTIPYTSDGVVYQIIPSIGVHQFDPDNKPLFFSPSSRVINNVDFTDISSFVVKGKVTYAGTDIPVEGAILLVDGEPVSVDNKPAQTDVNGNYRINVPIGLHYIEVQMNGHTFVDGGRYPVGANTKRDFQTDMSFIDFKDATKVTIAGRVVGGEIERDHPIGFGLSQANIGKATLKLQLLNPDKYILNDGSNSFTKSPASSDNSTLFIEKGKDIVIIKTDSLTGEYSAMLPPVPFKVIDIFTKNLNKEDFVISSLLPITPNVLLSYTDSTIVGNKKKEFVYNTKYNVMYKIPTSTIIVRDQGNDKGAFGDAKFKHTDPDGTVTEIDLYTVKADKTVEYKFGYPIFTQQNPYSFYIKAYEKYINDDNPNDIKVNMVPLVGKKMTIANNIGRHKIAISREDGSPLTADEKERSAEPTGGEIVLDEKGEGEYSFLGGFPKILGDKLLSLTMTLDNNGRSEKWEPNGTTFKGYVLGDISKGNNFVTKGPQIVDNIIRDPGGSNSFAYWEKGSVHTYFSLTNVNNIFESNVDIFTSLAPKLEFSKGLGLAFITEIKAGIELSGTVGFRETTIDRTNVRNSTEVLERISTSALPDYVGAMGDVYIGSSTNLLFGESDILSIRRATKNDPFEINNKEELKIGLEFGTKFLYTQHHIETALIPNLTKVRNFKLETVTSSEYNNLNYPNNTGANIYITTYKEGDNGYGLSNDDPYWGGRAYKGSPTTPQAPSYRVIRPKGVSTGDEILELNESIRQWKKQIALNEEAKLKSYKTAASNKSFDSGSSYEYSHTVRDINESSKFSFDYKSSTFRESNLAMAQEVGIQITYDCSHNDYTDTETGTEDEKSVTRGYVLADEDAGDYFSVDVFDPDDKTGYIFRTRGGVSYNPYETGEKTKYQQPGADLSIATMQVEKPYLYCANSEVVNQPSGTKAEFKIELGNQSDADADMWYVLRVDDSTNPDNAQIFIDGEALTDGRKFLLKAGTILYKTLTIAQGSAATDEYNNIRIILESPWQSGGKTNWPNIESSILLTAKFVPSCTPISLEIPDRIMNQTNNPKELLAVTIKGYDQNYQNLAAIQLQYKGENDLSWTTIKEYIVNKALRDSTQETQEYLPPKTAKINYLYNMHELSNQQYQFRAVTLCTYGNGFVNNETVPIVVTRDMTRPAAMGKPSPADGILTPQSEISILFNEPIQSGKIIDSGIRVVGVLNERPVSNNVGLKFGGNNMAYTEQPIYTNGAYSIEAWIRREKNKGGTLFAFGSGENIMSVGYTVGNKAFVKVVSRKDTLLFTSKITSEFEGWQYISFAYDIEGNRVELKRKSEESKEELFENLNLGSTIPSTNGRLYIGANPDKSNGFTGDIRQITMWNEFREKGAIELDFGDTKSGNERNLIGYWPLDEGVGNFAEDKARKRNLTLSTDWFIHPTGKAINLNGVDNRVELDIRTINMLNNDNYTLEFWFKAEADKPNQTIFSIGHGVKDGAPNQSLSIGFNANKKLELRSASNTMVLTNTNLLDNIWHHFALSVTRRGNAVAFIDGKQTWQKAATNVGAPKNDKVYLGVCSYRMKNEAQNRFEDYFKGSIDEVRIYKSALTAENIKLDMHAKLSGKEPGLKAYYPFEKYVLVSNNPEVYNSLTDLCSDSTAININSIFTDNTPVLKDVRPTERVGFNFTTSDNKIVINITEDIKRIENCILEFSVDRVMDLNGNYMEAEQWTAFVNLNRLKWKTDPVVIKKKLLNSETFKATIVNNSGTNESYVLQDLPTWLTASTSQGTLKPLETKEITFTIDRSLSIGTYEATIILTGNNKVNENLPVQIIVTGEHPDWNVDPSLYEHSMTLIGTVAIENVYQEDTADIVAAFNGNRCVGIASPRYIADRNGFYLFLDIYGNTDDMNKPITFSLWDASTGRIYPDMNVSSGAVKFTTNNVIGVVEAPTVLNAIDRIEQSMALREGWNWISVNVENDPVSNIDQFKTKMEDAGIQLKNVTQFISFSNSWSGSLTHIAPEEAYLLKTTRAHTLKLTGKTAKAASHPITLSEGWNWIGYVPQFTSSPKEAFAGLAVAEGDQVKTQKGFAIYSGNQWIGSLDYMKPCNGYLYLSKTPGTKSFVYPAQSSVTRNTLWNAQTEKQYWTANDAAFESNMTMVAVVEADASELSNENLELGAFCGNECRGSIRLQRNDLLGRTLAFLTVAGRNGEQIQFRLFDPETKTELRAVAEGEVIYRSNASIGTPDKPHVVEFETAIGNKNATHRIYPTRTKGMITLDYPLSEIKKIEVIDVTGAVVLVQENMFERTFDVTALADGVYTLSITRQDTTDTHRFVKQQ